MSPLGSLLHRLHIIIDDSGVSQFKKDVVLRYSSLPYYSLVALLVAIVGVANSGRSVIRHDAVVEAIAQLRSSLG